MNKRASDSIAISKGSSRGMYLVDGEEMSWRDVDSLVEIALKRDPRTIVIGPTLSLGPNVTAIGYEEPPYAIKDKRGHNRLMGYSPQAMWYKHFKAIMGIGSLQANKRGIVMNVDTVDRILSAAELLVGEGKGDADEYQDYFRGKLKKWNVESPADIPDDKKDDFFSEVDEGWKGDHEESGKEASRSRRAVDKVYVWVRMGDMGDYEPVNDASDAADYVAEYFDERIKDVSWVRGGVQIEPDFGGQNYISLYWGDEDADRAGDLSSSERDKFEMKLWRETGR